jgi:hypothetical protein
MQLTLNGLRSAITETQGAHALAASILKVRTIFEYAYDANLTDHRVRFGLSFRKPSKKVIGKARHAAGPRMIDADEARRMIEAAKQPLRAMIMLGANCGFGQTDVAKLPIAAISFNAGDVSFPRSSNVAGANCTVPPACQARFIARKVLFSAGFSASAGPVPLRLPGSGIIPAATGSVLKPIPGALSNGAG